MPCIIRDYACKCKVYFREILCVSGPITAIIPDSHYSADYSLEFWADIVENYRYDSHSKHFDYYPSRQQLTANLLLLGWVSFELESIMKARPAYITYKGRPLCQTHIERHSQMCGHLSIAAARRAVKVLQKHYYGLKVVPGECPGPN